MADVLDLNFIARAAEAGEDDHLVNLLIRRLGKNDKVQELLGNRSPQNDGGSYGLVILDPAQAGSYGRFAWSPARMLAGAVVLGRGPHRLRCMANALRMNRTAAVSGRDTLGAAQASRSSPQPCDPHNDRGHLYRWGDCLLPGAVIRGKGPRQVVVGFCSCFGDGDKLPLGYGQEKDHEVAAIIAEWYMEYRRKGMVHPNRYD